jgi:hypothetical protein
VNAIGIQFEFGAPKPHPPGGPNGYVNTTGPYFLGFIWTNANWEWRNSATRWHSTTLGFPWWPIPAALLMHPLIRALRWLEARRMARQRAMYGPPLPITHCQICGYDLRATPNRCPECGTVPPAVR